MTTIHVPTEAEFQNRLDGLQRLLTAREWERAAIVWAFTTADDSPSASGASFPCSAVEFAELGIAGLKSTAVVRLYRARWESAIEDGHTEPTHPGADVLLPEIPWEPTGHTSGSITKQSRTARVNKARELLADPAIATSVLADEALARDLEQELNRAAEQRLEKARANRAAQRAQHGAAADDTRSEQVRAWAQVQHALAKLVTVSNEAVEPLSSLDIGDDPDAAAAALARLARAEHRLGWLRSALEGKSASLDSELADMLSGE